MRVINRKSMAAAKLSLAAVFAAMGSTPAMAFRINLENPDAALNWDTTVRYNLGWRAEDPNRHFANAFGYDETETRFKKGDLVTNRLDLFTEMDYSLRQETNRYGFRVSAALWSENAYSSTSHTGDLINATFPGPAAVPSHYGPGARYSNYARRYLTGSSGEFVDAFAFGSFALGETLLNVKLGQHNVYWGETLYSAVDGISAGQAPLDGIKGATSPGAEAKELFMPINQLTANWTLSNEVSLMGQYQFDWKPFRTASGGTFFASSDASGDLFGADPMCAAVGPAGTCIRSLKGITPGRDGGDFGVALRWTPAWLDGTAGFYYRKYDEKLPWATMQLQGGNPQNPANLGVRPSFGRDTQMLGASLMKTIGTVSTGIDLSYRRDTALNSVPAFFAGSQGLGGVTQVAPGVFVPTYFLSPGANIPLSQTPTYEQAEGARGNTFHVVLNGVMLLKKTPLWETGDAQFEFAYQRLDKVTTNEDLFYSVDHACKLGYVPGGIRPGARKASDGCATRDSLVFNMGFNPKWMGVLPSLDLTMPISMSYGIHGNSPTLGGSFEGAFKWSIGLKAVYRTHYEFALTLSDQHQDYKTAIATASNGVPGQEIFSSGAGQQQVQNSHRWVSLRFKTTF